MSISKFPYLFKHSLPKHLIYYGVETIEVDKCYNPFNNLYHVCIKCGKVPLFPVKLNPCEHIMCQQCVLINPDSRRCILCHMNLEEDQQWHCSDEFGEITNLFFNHIVYTCPTPQCEFKGSCKAINSHLTNFTDCPNRTVHCPTYRCKAVMTLAEFTETHFNQCGEITVQCNNCNEMVRQKDVKTHDCV